MNSSFRVKSLMYLSFIISLTFLSSCYTWIPPRQLSNQDNVKFINKPYDQVWSSLVSYIGENNIPIKLMEKESGYISTEHNLFANSNTNFCDCGYFKNPDDEFYVFKKYGATMNINIVVKKVEDSKTKVTCNILFKGQPKSVVGVKDYTEQCFSTGVFEKQLFMSISE